VQIATLQRSGIETGQNPTVFRKNLSVIGIPLTDFAETLSVFGMSLTDFLSPLSKFLQSPTVFLPPLTVIVHPLTVSETSLTDFFLPLTVFLFPLTEKMRVLTEFLAPPTVFLMVLTDFGALLTVCEKVRSVHARMRTAFLLAPLVRTGSRGADPHEAFAGIDPSFCHGNVTLRQFPFDATRAAGKSVRQ